MISKEGFGMANEYALRCSLCGLNQDVDGTAADDLAAAKSGEGSVYICTACQAKVQYESEQKFR